MKSLKDQLRKINRESAKHPALMTHVVLGYPSLKESEDIVLAMADGGASLIELQIPFSDPMADGPTIMASNEAALSAGTTVKDCFRLAARLSRRVNVPLLFMSYFNILFRYHSRSATGGIKNFCKDAATAGIQGLIVADLTPDENTESYWELSKEAGLVPVPTVSPLSETSRLKKIASIVDEGFVYCVSTTGTTGARKKLPVELAPYLERVRRTFSLPLAVGFGISTPSQVQTLRGVADIAVVGSAMIDLIKITKRESRLKQVSSFTRQLAKN